MNYQEKEKIYQRAKKIVASDLEWEDKYDMIFSDEVSKKVRFDYYNPDTSYQEDVEAFVYGFEEYMEKERIIFNQIY